jgi:hypothetical protein
MPWQSEGQGINFFVPIYRARSEVCHPRRELHDSIREVRHATAD